MRPRRLVTRAVLVPTCMIALSGCGTSTALHKLSKSSGGPVDANLAHAVGAFELKKSIALLDKAGGTVTISGPYIDYFKRERLPAGCHPSAAQVTAALRHTPATVSLARFARALCG